MGTKIIIADDHPLFRAALKYTLQGANSFAELEIVECQTIAEVHVQLESDAEPDVVLLDLHMPGATGFGGLVNLRSCFPSIPIVIISGDDSHAVVCKAEQLGAAGFISKALTPEKLQQAIAAVLDGRTWFDKAAAERDPELEDIAARVASLTPHQFRVFSMVSLGLLNKQIGYDLNVTEPTVKSHVTAIMRKLGVRKRTEVILLAKKLESGTGGEGAPVF